jgi:hypothetical protein
MTMPKDEDFCLRPVPPTFGACVLLKGHATACRARVRVEEAEREAYEAVHHPTHYNQGDIEHCELVEDQGHAEGYYFGQVTKYVFRTGHKPTADSLEDLKKAHWYMARWVAWRTYGKAIWKIVRRDPEVVFKPSVLAAEVSAAAEGRDKPGERCAHGALLSIPCHQCGRTEGWEVRSAPSIQSHVSG